MKLSRAIRTPRSGEITLDLVWRPDGWSILLIHDSRLKPNGDGLTDADREFSWLMTNEMLYEPVAVSHILEDLWEDIKEDRVSAERAHERFDAMVSWIEDTTQAYPGDRAVYGAGAVRA